MLENVYILGTKNSPSMTGYLCIYLYISIIRSLLYRILVRSIIDLGQLDEVGPLFVFEGRVAYEWL